MNTFKAVPTLSLAAALFFGLLAGCTAQDSEYDEYGASYGYDDSTAYGSPAPAPSGNAPQQYNPQAAQKNYTPVTTSGTESSAQQGFFRYTATEQAFTVELPNGWRGHTRIDRSAGFGGIPWSTYASPDNQMVVRVPDHPMTLHALPNPQMGMYEGGTAGYGRIPVRSYVPGPQYAAEHGWRIAQALGCQNPQVIDQRDRPDFLQQSSATPNAQSRFTQITIGQATVQCRQDGQSRVIITQASTVGMSNGAWYTSTLHMTAPGAKAEEAARIFEHLNQTHTPNPEWVQRETAVGERTFAEKERLRQQQARQWAASRPRSTWSPGTSGGTYAGGTSDKSHQDFINSIRGTQDLTDRYGDTVYGVESYSTYHWQDGQGNIVGTDINENPNPLEYERMGTPPRR